MSSQEHIHTIAILPIKDGKTEEFVNETRLLVKAVEELEPGTSKYYFFLSTNDQGQDQMIAVEKYTDDQASKDHAETPHLSAFIGTLGHLTGGSSQVFSGRFVVGFERPEALN